MRRLEITVAAIALAVLAFGIALQPLLTPRYTRELTDRLSQLPAGEAAAPAEVTRRFVTGDATAREELESLMPPDAVSHLEDVRSVIAGAQLFSALLAGAIGIWIALRVFQRHTDPVAAALKVAAVIDVGLVAFAGLLGLTDFDALFARFHTLFFAAGTWVFPSDSLLIRLFPEQFWITAGVSWAVLVVAVAALYALCGWLLGRSTAAQAHREYTPSRDGSA